MTIAVNSPSVPARVPSRWPLPPLLRLSVVVHAAVALGWALRPDLWPGLLAALVLDHAAITAAGLWPRSRLLGANLVRLPPAAAERGEIALTIDDGPDPAVTPQVLDLLDAAGARATFFCIAERVCAHPELAREIVRRGHALENHSQRHRHTFSLLGPGGLAREVDAAQAAIAAITDQRPTLFRAPAGLRNPFLAPVLHQRGLTLASWTRRGFDTRVAEPARVLAALTRNLAAGDILLLHDGNAARDATGQPVVLAVLPELLAACRRAGLLLVTLPQALRPDLRSTCSRLS